MRINKYQWGFFKGFANEFDIFRIAFEWRSWDKAAFRCAFFGFQFGITFPCRSINQLKRDIKMRWL